MGWVAADAQGTRIVEHNGILSTFYAEAVLLPESGYGFVLLYNEYALTASTLAFPALKNGMVALLTGQKPASGRLTVPMLGLILGAFSLPAIGLSVRSLLRLPQRKARALVTPLTPRLKRVPGVVWTFAPAILLLALPQLLAQSIGRYFGHVMLARAMPEVIILLVICGGLGGLNGIMRLVVLVRHAQRPVAGDHV